MLRSTTLALIDWRGDLLEALPLETLERSRLAWPLNDTEIRVQTTRLPMLQTLPKYRRPALTELRTLLIAALLHIALIIGAVLTPRPQRPDFTETEHQRRWAQALGPALRPGALVLDEFCAARKWIRCALDGPPRAPHGSQLLRFGRPPRAPLDRHSLEHALATWTPPKPPGKAERRRRRPPRTFRSPKAARPARPPRPQDPTGSIDIFPPAAGSSPGMSAPDPSGANRVIACSFGPRGTDAQAAASSAIRKHLRRIRYCYERALTRAAPDLAGTIVLKLDLQNTRLHEAQIVENSLHDPQTEACVLRVLKTISYPEYRSEQIRQARYPITFESR